MNEAGDLACLIKVTFKRETMIKGLLYVALLMGVSLCAMEERVERGKVSDERISAVLSLLLSKQQQSAAVEPNANTVWVDTLRLMR